MGLEQYASYIWDTSGLSGSYDIRVKAIDYSGNSSAYMEASYRLDKTAPAVPSNVTASGSSGSITVTWDEVSDTEGDLWGYYIYRQLQEDPLPEFTYIGSVNKAAVCNFTDFGIETGESYKYAVSSRDKLGNESAKEESGITAAPDYTPVITEFSNGTDPLTVYPGDTLSIKATGFKPYEGVYMHVDSTDASNTAILNRWADASGSVSISWRYVVGTAAGNHSITLKGDSSNGHATKYFTTSSPVSLPAAPAAVTVTDTGVLSVLISVYGPRSFKL